MSMFPSSNLKKQH